MKIIHGCRSLFIIYVSREIIEPLDTISHDLENGYLYQITPKYKHVDQQMIGVRGVIQTFLTKNECIYVVCFRVSTQLIIPSTYILKMFFGALT